MEPLIQENNVSETANLTWALAIATYNRPDVLLRCVELAVKQTRPPKEIVIVDSSDDWSTTRDLVLSLVEKLGFGGPTVFEKALTRGQPAQRNQVIDLSTADVLFLVDDDTLMFRDCARRVMEVYEKDVEGKVVGVSPQEAVEPPPTGSGEARDIGRPLYKSVSRRLKDSLARWIVPHMFYPWSKQAPPDLSGTPLTLKLGVRPIDVLLGFRMTMRREVAAKEKFESSLIVAAMEDYEGCLRFARSGMFVELDQPLLFHMVSPRPSKIRRDGPLFAAFSVLNHTYIVLKNYGNDAEVRRYIRWSRGRYITWFFTYGIMVRDFCRYRGARVGAKYANELMEQSNADNLRQLYEQISKNLMNDARFV